MKKETAANPLKNMQRFADITKEMFLSGNVTRAERCLQTAEHIYQHGDKRLRNAMENVYIYSLSSFLTLHHFTLKLLLPKHLHEAYQKQINAICA